MGKESCQGRPMSDSGIPHRVRSVRQERRLSQNRLNDVSGCSSGYINRLESGKLAKRGVATDISERIAAALGVNADWLVRGVGERDAVPLPEGIADLPEEALVAVRVAIGRDVSPNLAVERARQHIADHGASSLKTQAWVATSSCAARSTSSIMTEHKCPISELCSSPIGHCRSHPYG